MQKDDEHLELVFKIGVSTSSFVESILDLK